MKYVKAFEEYRMDKGTWYGQPKGEDRKPGAKGYKGKSRKDYQRAKHQTVKADREEGKLIGVKAKKGQLDESVNENLKTVVAGLLIGLSSLISNPSKAQYDDMFNPSNPIGFTNPMSPNNPTGIMNPSSPINIYNNMGQGNSEPTYYYFNDNRQKVLDELNKLEIKDENLKKAKTELSKDAREVDSKLVIEYLKAYSEINKYQDIKGVLDTFDKVSSVDFKNMSSKEKEEHKSTLLRAIEQLKEMQKSVSNYNTDQFVLIALLSICGLLLLVVLGMLGWMVWDMNR